MLEFLKKDTQKDSFTVGESLVYTGLMMATITVPMYGAVLVVEHWDDITRTVSDTFETLKEEISIKKDLIKSKLKREEEKPMIE
jgi:hypothetical protein